jgi:UDP-N-acetylglucosamine 4,6-dehydratase (inverting)
MLNNKSILITGATGSFGQQFIKVVLKKYKKIKRLIIFSRDEFKQYILQKEYNQKKYSFLRFFLGDVRNKDRLTTALNGVDIVIHAAALKQVPAAEYNPFEYINTNVIGAENLIRACFENKVQKVIALSTDKAAAPINLYGATKLCSDKLFIAANNIRGNNNISFSVVRYGNVMMSRGSIVPLFQEISKTSNVLPITDLRMTRFNININSACEFVLKCLKISKGDEIFVPKIPSLRITDLAKAINRKCKFKMIGMRPGEKLHEEMITINDSLNTLETKDYFIILPPDKIKNYLKKNKNCRLVKENFSYNSFNNNHYLKISGIEKIIKRSQ